MFLHTNHEKPQMEIKKMIPYIVTSKRKKKYLGINVVKEIKGPCTESKASQETQINHQEGKASSGNGSKEAQSTYLTGKLLFKYVKNSCDVATETTPCKMGLRLE